VEALVNLLIDSEIGPQIMHQHSSQNEQTVTETPQPEHKADNGTGADIRRNDSQADIADTDRAAIDLARVQGYVMRDMEIVIGHTIEQAVSNATAPLLARIEAQTAQIEQLTATQKAAQAAQAAAQASYAEAQASLAGRIEAHAVAQRLLMDALQQLRKDHAPETAGIAVLSAEIVQLKEATQRSIEEALTKTMIPYLKQVRKVSQEVHRVEGENNRLKMELEAVQRLRRPWWKFWKG
jgi:chromosome segregation ATPase